MSYRRRKPKYTENKEEEEIEEGVDYYEEEEAEYDEGDDPTPSLTTCLHLTKKSIKHKTYKNRWWIFFGVLTSIFLMFSFLLWWNNMSLTDYTEMLSAKMNSKKVEKEEIKEKDE